ARSAPRHRRRVLRLRHWRDLRAGEASLARSSLVDDRGRLPDARESVPREGEPCHGARGAQDARSARPRDLSRRARVRRDGRARWLKSGRRRTMGQHVEYLIAVACLALVLAGALAYNAAPDLYNGFRIHQAILAGPVP